MLWAYTHTRQCLLMPACRRSGYGVFTYETTKYLSFDAAGNQKALALIEASKKLEDFRVEVTGEIQGDKIKVITLKPLPEHKPCLTQPSVLRTEKSIAQRLDDMIAALERSPQCDLLIEHLHSARVYLLSAMPEEFLLALELAKTALNTIRDDSLRRAMSADLTNLLDEMSLHEILPVGEPRHHAHSRIHKPAPPGGASALRKFFNVSDTSFGIFYPTRFIVASLPSFDAAKGAERALLDAGFTPDEVVAATGKEMLQFFEDLRLRTGLWGGFMETLSLALGTEATFVVQDSEQARAGAAFLAVYDPREAETEHICKLVAPWRPISMRRYAAGSIETLI